MIIPYTDKAIMESSRMSWITLELHEVNAIVTDDIERLPTCNQEKR
jgi:hypothetical protein